MKYGFANFWKEGTSALGQKQTSGHDRLMSALPPIADITESDWDVRFVPQADIEVAACGCQKHATSRPCKRRHNGAWRCQGR